MKVLTLPLKQHVGTGSPYGVTDGFAASPSTTSYTINAAKKNIIDNIGYIYMRHI